MMLTPACPGALLSFRRAREKWDPGLENTPKFTGNALGCYFQERGMP